MSAAIAPSHRLESIDWLRGFVMIVMALDHVRDYFSSTAVNPLADPDVAAALFATRWITHICAPTFVLLAGVSAGLMARRKTPAELSRFLLARGLWLIFLEATVVTFSWKFNLTNAPAGVILQVIWAIGVAMVLLAALIHLPRSGVVVAGTAIVLGSNLLDGVLPASALPGHDALWLSIHRQIVWAPFGGIKVLVVYPVLGWCGVMACGYGLAPIFGWESERRRHFLFRLGGGLLSMFLLLRGLNLYGDPVPWQAADSWGRSVMSFLNVTKDPPSVLFLAATLGLALSLLAAVERRRSPLHDAVVTIGRVPLFYYVAHLYVAHLLAIAAGVLQGLPARAWFVSALDKPEGYGFGLPVVYLVWIGLVFALYPACRWFARIKAQRRDGWLSYL